MKGFVEVITDRKKVHEFVNIANIVSMRGSTIITNAPYKGFESSGMYEIKTLHTHKELVEILNKSIEESK